MAAPAFHTSLGRQRGARAHACRVGTLPTPCRGSLSAPPPGVEEVSTLHAWARTPHPPRFRRMSLLATNGLPAAPERVPAAESRLYNGCILPNDRRPSLDITSPPDAR